MQREFPASSLTTSRYLSNSLPSLLGPIQFVSAYFKISVSSGVMHSRFPNLSEACRAYYTSCRNVTGIFFIKRIWHVWCCCLSDGTWLFAYVCLITIKLNTLWCIYYYRIVAVDLSSHVLTKVIQGSLPIFFQYFLIQKWIVLLYSNFYFSILMRPFGTTLYYIFLSLVYTCFKVSCRPFDIFIFL